MCNEWIIFKHVGLKCLNCQMQQLMRELIAMVAGMVVPPGMHEAKTKTIFALYASVHKPETYTPNNMAALALVRLSAGHYALTCCYANC